MAREGRVRRELPPFTEYICSQDILLPTYLATGLNAEFVDVVGYYDCTGLPVIFENGSRRLESVLSRSTFAVSAARLELD